jgi:amino acid permease
MSDAMSETTSVDAGIQVAEAMDRVRRQMLIMVVVACTAWFAPQIVLTFSAELLSRTVVVILTLAGMAGAVAWMVQMWRYHRFQKRLGERPDLRHRLDDERVRTLRLQAIYRAWWVLAVVVAIGVGIGPFVELPHMAVLLTLLLLTVNLPIVFFLSLDRD